jgi:hypothetical protein
VAGAKFAETVYPLRMVIITASFPYRQQLEVYRKALKVKSIAELASSKDPPLMPEFVPCKVQRRQVYPNGKVSDWAPLDLEGAYRPILQLAIGSQPEDSTIKPVIFPKTPLVMPVPKLARGDYPSIKLPTIDKAAKEIIAKSDDGKKPTLGPLEMRIKGEGLSVYEPVALGEDRREGGAADQPKQGDELIIPECALVRLIDADPKLKPGATYQYQVKMQLRNPNYKQTEKVAYESLATPETLESDWAPADPTKAEVKVSRELFYYPVKLDDKGATANLKERSDPTLSTNRKDVAFVQAHHWVESVRLDPENPASKVPLGDWAITDLPVKRGEYINRTENVEMAIWYPTREGWDMAIPVRKGRQPFYMGRPLPGIPVSFVTEDLLVDWEGGRVEASVKVAPDKPSRTINENADLEILVLGPDGSLRVQNSAMDVKNAEREKRAAEAKKLLDDVKSKSKLGKPAMGDPLAPK